MGVFHLASKMCDRLLTGSDKEYCELVKLAALLHDVGHGPFSHVSESVLEACYNRSSIKLEQTEKIHEKLTCQIISESTELRRLLGEDRTEKLIGLLQGTWGDKVLKGIVSGPIDADKLDYLLRDSYYCGVAYGVYDVDRLLGSLCVLNFGEERQLAVADDDIHSLEQFVLAKYYMTTQVYRHKVRLITDQMIVRALLLGINVDGIDWLRRIYAYDGSSEQLQEWLKWSDELLISSICNPSTPDGYAKCIFNSLQDRALFKRIYHKRVREFSPLVRDKITQSFRGVQKLLEQAVAGMIDLDHNLVIAHRYTIQSVREQSRDSEGSIMVSREAGLPVSFEEESVLFHSIDEAQKDEWLDVFAPVKFKDDRDRRLRMKELDKRITEAVESIVGSLAEKEGEEK